MQTRHSNKPKRGANTFATRGRPVWRLLFGCFGGVWKPIVGLRWYKALGLEMFASEGVVDRVDLLCLLAADKVIAHEPARPAVGSVSKYLCS